MSTQNSDRLGSGYAAVADDSQKSGQHREAAMLISVAEQQLDSGSDPSEVLRSAQQAMSLFKEAGDKNGIADSLRLIVRANIEKADSLRWDDESSEEAQEILNRTESMVQEELDRARDKSDKRTQGAMLLSLSQMNYRRSDRKRDEALQTALQAELLFEQVGDARLQAITCITLSRIYHKKNDAAASATFANKAVTIYQSLGDKVGEGEAWHSVGAAKVRAYKISEALEVCAKAAALYKEAGNMTMYARECHAIADWSMKHNDAVTALPAAREAHTNFKTIGYGKGWETSALCLVVESLIAMQKVDSALREAKRAVRDFKARGNKKEQCRCMSALVAAMAADNNHDEAEAVVEDAIQIARSSGDKHLQIEMHKLATQLLLSSQNYQKALRHAESVKELYKDLGATKDEARELVHTVTRVNYLAGNKKEAKQSADEARQLAAQLGDRNAEAYALLASAAAARMNDDHEQAIKDAQEAADLFHDDGDKDAEARALLQVCHTRRAQGDLRGALSAAEDSLDVRAEMGDRRTQCELLLLMADLQMEMSQPKDARDLLTQGVKLAKENQDDMTSAQILVKILQAYSAMLEKESKESRVAKELVETAVKSGKEAVRLAKLVQDMRLEAQASYWLACHYLIAERYGEMVQAANDATSLFKQSGNTSGQVDAMCLMGKAFMQQDRGSRAVTVVEDAVTLAKRTGDANGEAKASAMLKEIEKSMTKAGPAVVVAAADAAPTAAAADAGAAAPAAAAPAAGAVAAYVAPDVGLVKERIQLCVSGMTGDEIDPDTPFMEAGIDSLASVELRTNLQKAFGVSLPSTVMFNYPSTVAMADFILEEMVEAKVALS